MAKGDDNMKQIKATIIVIAMIFLCGCTGGKSESNTTEATTSTTLANEVTTSDNRFTTSAKPFYTKEIETIASDPYSDFIKQKCIAVKKDWDSANSKERERGFEKFVKAFDDMYYFLYDINGDGTNELLLGSWHRLGNDIDASDSTMKICISSIYTLKNGKIIKIDSGNWWVQDLIQDRILYSNGKIVDTFGYKDIPSYFILSLKDDKLTVESYVMHTEKGYSKIVDYEKWEDKEISQKEYYSIFNQFCGDAKKVDIDWKRIDEYGM